MKISLCKRLFFFFCFFFFAVQKGFQAVAGTLKSIKRLRDGSFLVECGKRAQAQNLLRTNQFIDRPVKVSVRKTLNSSRGVIRCWDLTGMSEVEIWDEVKDQGVRYLHKYREASLLCLTETWLSELDPDPQLPGFTLMY